MPKSLRNNLIPIILITLVVAYAVMAFARTSSPRTEETSFNALVSEINAGNIKSVSVSSEGNSIRAVKKSDGSTITLNKEPTVDIIQLLIHYGVTQDGLKSFEYRVEGVPFLAQISSILIYLLPVILIGGFFLFTMRRAQNGADQAFSFGRSRARRITSETPVVTFQDVAGCDESKMELVEVVEFLKNPRKVHPAWRSHSKGRITGGTARKR